MAKATTRSFMIDDLLKTTHGKENFTTDQPSKEVIFIDLSSPQKIDTKPETSAENTFGTSSHVALTPHQLQVLMKAFTKQPRLTRTTRKRLAKQLDIAEESVSSWFQHAKLSQINQLSESSARIAKLAYLSTLANSLSKRPEVTTKRPQIQQPTMKVPYNRFIGQVPPVYPMMPQHRNYRSSIYGVYPGGYRMRPSPYMMPYRSYPVQYFNH